MTFGSKLNNITLFAILFSCIAYTASAFHGEAISVHPNADVEVVIAFDPEDAGARGYIASHYGFTQDVLSAFSANADVLAGLTESLTIYLDFEADGDLLYTVSRLVDGEWVADEQNAYGRPAESAFLIDVLCEQILSVDCSKEAADQIIAFDQSVLTDVPEQPFISVGTFPLSPTPNLNVYLDNTSLDEAISFDAQIDGVADLPGGAKLSGTARQAIDFFTLRRPSLPAMPDDQSNIEQDQNSVPIPFEQDSNLDNDLDISPGFDSRLRYITVHCTGPGVMSASQIRNYAVQGRRNKGHGYIMLDGSYISVASIAENPNVTYATKTETCLRNEAFGSMFNIELNYNCHWRPSRTGSASDKMLDRLADVVIWTHQNIGPLGIISHTYVDMGLVDGHTDPQDNPGFDWQSLYERIEDRGGDLEGITLIDPEFAAAWPISRTDRAHEFPPKLAGSLSTGRDECRRHASH